MPESAEHIKIKNKVSERLKTWFGCSIKEYPESGHELDVFAVTNNGITIYVEIIWSTSQVHFLKDLKSIEHANAQIKIVIVNPEILQKSSYVRQFEKTVANQRIHGYKMCGNMLDGSTILNEDNFLDGPFKQIIDTLLLEIKANSGSFVVPDKASSFSLTEKEVEAIFKDYAQQVISQYTNFSNSGRKDFTDVIEQLSKFDFSKYYVRVFVQDLKNRFLTSSENMMSSWLGDSALNGLFIIGDFGTGKSTLCAHLAYELANEFLKNESSRIPLFISLRNVENTSEEFLAKELKKVVKMDWEQIMHLAKSGKILFILDGFDEIPKRTDWKKTLADFENIVKIFCVGKSKVITTCRTHFFKKDSEIWGEDTELMKSLRASKNFKIVSMVPLTEEQIFEFIKKRTDNPEKIWSQIKETYNLEDLCRRPLLADMIISTLPKLISMGTEISPITLYEKYTEDWIEREDWRSQLTPSAKGELMERLAYTLFCQEKYTISYEGLRGIIETEFPIKKGSEVSDYYDYDIRTCSFFRRDVEGNYSFMHKSFLEFFVAKKIARSVNHGNFLELCKKSLPNEVVFFATKIINPSNKSTLFDAIYYTREKSLEEFGILGGNAIKLLYKMGLTKFIKQDFSSCTIQDADLSGCQFEECRFDGTKMKKVSFDSSTIAKCNFEETHLESCRFYETKIVLSNFTKSVFLDVSFRDSEISNECGVVLTEFNKCSFNNFVFKGISFKETSFNGSNPEFEFLNPGIYFVNCKMESGKFRDSFMPLSLFQEFEAKKTTFVNSDFGGTCFYKCVFSDSTFKTGSISFATFIDVKCNKTQFTDLRLYNTYLKPDEMGDITFDRTQIKRTNETYHEIPCSQRKRIKFNPNLEPFCALNRVIETFSLDDEFEDKVIEKYLTSWDAIKGSGKTPAIAVCFYDLCKETNRPRTFKELAIAFNVNERELFRIYSRLLSAECTKPRLVNSETWIEIYAKELKISEQTEILAKKMLTTAKNIRLTKGRGKTTIAAALLYLACKKNSEKITIKTIANLAKLTTTTISLAKKSLSKGLDSSDLSS